MSCGHCTAAIEKAVRQADTQASVTCDLDTKIVEIASNLPNPALKEILLDAGYAAEPA